MNITPFLSKRFFYRFLTSLCLFLVCLNCSNNNSYDRNCNFLLNVGIQVSLNLNLAQYNQLTFANNPVYVPDVGNGGLFVNNTGVGYVAFDAADPNAPLGACSILLIDGIEAYSSCDETRRYSLFTGQPLQNPELRCSLKPYFIERVGNELFISN
jgi:hypothetical protein